MARDYPDSFVLEPVDRVAGRVLSRGYHHEFKKSTNNREVWDTPPDVLPPCYTPEPIQVLMGQRKGSLVVVGYLGLRVSPSGNKKKYILLVRCDCGKYEERVARHWKRTGNEIFERCQFCDQRESLKVRHLSNAEKDRLENLQRTRAGLPTKQDAMLERLEKKLFNFYARGRNYKRPERRSNRWKPVC